jgi:hypothetical protein
MVARRRARDRQRPPTDAFRRHGLAIADNRRVTPVGRSAAEPETVPSAATTPVAAAPDAVVREYEARLAARRTTLAARERACFRVSNLRLAIAAAALVLFIVGGPAHAAWLLVPLAAFVAAAAWHARLLNARDRARSATGFYERSLARVGGEWPGHGRDGAQFADPDHPYAADLDLFGRGSLFELLATSRTSEGDRTLARWLLAPADRPTIRERQDAIAELATRLDLREAVAVMGDVVETGEHVEVSRVRAWASTPVRLRGTTLRLALAVLATVTLAAIIWWGATGGFAAGLALLLVVQILIAQAFKARVHDVAETVEEAAHDLDVLVGLLRLVEAETFTSPLLQRLQGALADRRRPPSRDVARLSTYAALLASRENLLFALPSSLVMWTTQWAFTVDAWRARVGPELVQWLAAIGELEALLALSTLAFEHPDYVWPDVVDGPPIVAAGDLAHPAMPAGAVANDLALGEGPVRLCIVSGSNMSGKSTWLRTIGANVVLALAGAPVRASRFRVSPVDVGAAISIQDSLADGRSKFFSEVRRLAQVSQLAADRDGRVLFLFDEILGGTNSHDRRIGAEAVLANLVRRGAIGLATTHDLALGEMADRLAPAAVNVHFEDQFGADGLTFDYRIRPGVVRTSNALALMRSVGLDV